MKLSEIIEIPFTSEAVIQILDWGTNPKLSPYTHKQIAEWCSCFWAQYLEVDAPKKIERLLPILASVDIQWELFLANTYTLEELQTQNLEPINLPVSWFQEWLFQAKG